MLNPLMAFYDVHDRKALNTTEGQLNIHQKTHLSKEKLHNHLKCCLIQQSQTDPSYRDVFDF